MNKGNTVIFRGRKLKQSSTEGNRGIDEEEIEDDTRGISGMLHDLIHEGCDVSKQIRLSHLNNITRSLRRSSGPVFATCELPLDTVFSWLACLLIDQEREVRAAALRLLRYTIKCPEDLDVALKLHVDVLASRCMDIVLDNSVERIQFVRLVSHLIHICPNRVPPSLLRPVLAVAMSGRQESDRLSKASLAVLCELAVRNSDLFMVVCDGLSSFVHCILHSFDVRVSEILCPVIAYLLDRPHSRFQSNYYWLLAQFLAPLADSTFCLDAGDGNSEATPRPSVATSALDEHQNLVDACQATLIFLMRSWPTLLCMISRDRLRGCGESLLGSFVRLFYCDRESTKVTLLAIICEVLDIQRAETPFESYVEAGDFAAKRLKHRDWVITMSPTYGFVVAEADFCLASMSERRVHLVRHMRAFLLLALVDAGVLQALTYVIISSQSVKFRVNATYVLAAILTQCGNCLSREWCKFAFALPFAGTNHINDSHQKDTGVFVDQNHCTLIYWLEYLMKEMRKQAMPRSLQLKGSFEKYLCTGDAWTIGSRTDGPMPTPTASEIRQMLKDSRVSLGAQFVTSENWDWLMIERILNMLTDEPNLLEDSSCAKFLAQLVQYFLPGGAFSKLNDDYDQFSKLGCIVFWLAGLCAHDAIVSNALGNFLGEINRNLAQGRLHTGVLSVKNLLGSGVGNGLAACQDYFLFIGKLSSSQQGCVVLETSGCFQRLFDLINTDTAELYVKLVVSSLDYAQPGQARIIFLKALTSSSDRCRLYCTSYLRVLARLKVPDFAVWGTQALLGQLQDSSKGVVFAALAVLDEVLQASEYRHVFTKYHAVTAQLTELGDAGVLLTPYLFCDIPLPVDVTSHIERWKNNFNAQYVRIVEERLHELISGHKRKDCGGYMRKSNVKIRLADDELGYAPAHLYGMLGRTVPGCDYLTRRENCIEPLWTTIKRGVLDTPAHTMEMKAALWALGHVASSDCGLATLNPGFIPSVIKIAEECPVYSLRGTAYFVLNLIAQCPTGASVLRELGWEVSLGGGYHEANSENSQSQTLVALLRSCIDNDTESLCSGDASSPIDCPMHRRTSTDELGLSHSLPPPIRKSSRFAASVSCVMYDSGPVTIPVPVLQEDGDVEAIARQGRAFSMSRRSDLSGDNHSSLGGASITSGVGSFGSSGYCAPVVSLVPKLSEERESVDSMDHSPVRKLSHRSIEMRKMLALKHEPVAMALLDGDQCMDFGAGDVQDMSVHGLARWRTLQRQRTIEPCNHFMIKMGSSDDSFPDLSPSKMSIGSSDGFVVAPWTFEVASSTCEGSYCLPVDIQMVCSGDFVLELPHFTNFDRDHWPSTDIMCLDRHVTDACLRCSGMHMASAKTEQTIIAPVTDLNKMESATGPTSDVDGSLRKEVFRLIALLNVRRKYAEQGLLRLKQQFPAFFQRVCLYSDVAYLLSTCPFTLTARRFLQELFQDLEFDLQSTNDLSAVASKLAVDNGVHLERLVSDFFCPNTGGVESHIYYLGQCLVDRGHHVVVVTHAYGSRRGIRYFNNNLKVYYLPFVVFYNGCILPSVYATLPVIRQILLREKVHVLHGHSSFSALAHEAMFHAQALGIHTVFTDHSLFGFADASSILTNKLLQFSLCNCDHAICVSHTSKENTVLRAGLPPDRVSVIPNAIESSMFTPAAKTARMPTSITIVVVSRLVYRKGTDLLAALIPEVCRQHADVQFLIAGDGPKRVLLEEVREKEQLQERVTLLGAVPHTAVRNILVQGQIFLNTSLTEAFCMAIVEAASCGLYVVSTKVGGLPEVLPPDLITLADTSSTSLVESLNDAIWKHRRGQMPPSQETHQRIKRIYCWQDVAMRTEKVYLSILEHQVPTKTEKLRKYLKCGAVFNIFFLLLTVFNYAAVFLLTWFSSGNEQIKARKAVSR